MKTLKLFPKCNLFTTDTIAIWEGYLTNLFVEELLYSDIDGCHEVGDGVLHKLNLEHIIIGRAQCEVSKIFVKDNYIQTYRVVTDQQRIIHEIGSELNNDVEIDSSVVTNTLVNLQFISMVYAYLFTEYEVGRESVRYRTHNRRSTALRLEDVLINGRLYAWVFDYKLYLRLSENILSVNIVDTTTNTQYVEFKLPRKPLEKLMGDLDKLPIRPDGTIGIIKED